MAAGNTGLLEVGLNPQPQTLLAHLTEAALAAAEVASTQGVWTISMKFLSCGLKLSQPFWHHLNCHCKSAWPCWQTRAPGEFASLNSLYTLQGEEKTLEYCGGDRQDFLRGVMFILSFLPTTTFLPQLEAPWEQASKDTELLIHCQLRRTILFRRKGHYLRNKAWVSLIVMNSLTIYSTLKRDLLGKQM